MRMSHCDVISSVQLVTQDPCIRRIMAGFIFGHLYTLPRLSSEIKSEYPGQLTLDGALRGRIMVESLPGASFHANRGRRCAH
jgi:hypothetical protein